MLTQGERKSKSVGYVVREVAWIWFVLCMRWMGTGKILKICIYVQAPNSSNWKTLPDEPTYLARVMYSYFTLRI